MKKITKIDLFNLQDNPIIIYDFIFRVKIKWVKVRCG